MATPTKAHRVLEASASNAAGATKTGTALSLTTAFGGLATLVITNGGTGPTLPCTAAIEHSPDNTNWYPLGPGPMSAPTTASAVTTFDVEVPMGVRYIRSKFTGNTAQAVTVEAFFQEVSSIVFA